MATGMQLDIKLKDGKLSVNGKHLSELDTKEREFMNQFFKEVKINDKSYE